MGQKVTKKRKIIEPGLFKAILLQPMERLLKMVLVGMYHNKVTPTVIEQDLLIDHIITETPAEVSYMKRSVLSTPIHKKIKGILK